MSEAIAYLKTAREHWWREVDGCAPVTDAGDDFDSTPGQGWLLATIEHETYLVSPDGETVIATSEFDPVEPLYSVDDFIDECVNYPVEQQAEDEAALKALQDQISADVFKALTETRGPVPWTDRGIEIVTNSLISTVQAKIDEFVEAGIIAPVLSLDIPAQTEADRAAGVIRWSIKGPPEAIERLRAAMYPQMLRPPEMVQLPPMPPLTDDVAKRILEAMREIEVDPEQLDQDDGADDEFDHDLDAERHADLEERLHPPPEPSDDFNGPCENHVCTEACIDPDDDTGLTDDEIASMDAYHGQPHEQDCPDPSESVEVHVTCPPAREVAVSPLPGDEYPDPRDEG